MLCVLRNTLWMLGGQVEISHTDIVLGEWWVGGWMAGCVGGMQWWVLVASKLPDRVERAALAAPPNSHPSAPLQTTSGLWTSPSWMAGSV